MFSGSAHFRRSPTVRGQGGGVQSLTESGLECIINPKRASPGGDLQGANNTGSGKMNGMNIRKAQLQLGILHQFSELCRNGKQNQT
jgi:hypothetical protein